MLTPVMWGPLGGYDRFTRWSARPREWGADGRSRVWFGGQVVDGLAEVIDEHVATVWERDRLEAMPAALGCVPWLTHGGIAERFARLTACCVVVDKGHRSLSRVLVDADNGFPNVLPGLQHRVPGGEPHILGPYSPKPEYTVGPVRAVGMAGDRAGKPLLHAKLLVLGRLRFIEIGDGPTMEEMIFEPQSVWWGSANWTQGSQSHLEMGTWCEDRQIAEAATAFLDDLIGFSESLVSVATGPEPDLVAVEWDDEAMREAMRDMEPWDAPEDEEP